MENKEEKIVIDDEKAFLDKVEDAAKKGAKKAARSGSIWTVIIVAALAVFLVLKLTMSIEGFKTLFNIGDVDGHDVTLNNHWIFGYQVADFEEAVLGPSSMIQKLEVFTQDMTDTMTVEDAGFAGIKWFSSTQTITYHGTAVYTVDLAQLKSDSLVVDNNSKTVTLYIPHAVQEEININEEEMEISDTQKGFMRFGEIEYTYAQTKDLQNTARNKMETKLSEQNILETADEFALKAVTDLYRPIIKGIAKNYDFVVKFVDEIPVSAE